jgi:iron complex transport system ATP-binding protein
MGFHKQDAGSIWLDGNPLGSRSRRQLARLVGLLFQESENNMPATVLETVLLGRHPYAENLFWDSAEDLSMAFDALKQVGLGDLAERQVGTLSGGEKQRLAIALLLLQNPRLLLLDEPSNHLDIDNQIQILNLLAERTSRERGALLMASHDINLVARFCDRVLLLMGEGEVVEGPAQLVLTPENLERAFHCRITMIEHSGRRYFVPA